MNDISRKGPPPADADDNPEWTEEDFARARPASEVHGPEVSAMLVRKRGRPGKPAAERKQPVSIRLSPDVLAALRATGDGWQTRVDALLKAAFDFGELKVVGAHEREEALVQASLRVAFGDADGKTEVLNDNATGKPAGKKRA